MVEVMTDKATVEIPSPRAGTVARDRLSPRARSARSAQVLVVIDDGGRGGRGAGGRRRGAATAAAPRRRRERPAAGTASRQPPAARAADRGGAGARDAGVDGERVLATPATRKLARELGVDLGARAADRHARPRHHATT